MTKASPVTTKTLPTGAIEPVPAPWTLKGTIYVFFFWTGKDAVAQNRDFMYSPLEAGSAYAAPEGSQPLGGASTVQIIRYTESPVGPYDELILIPGFHEYTVDEDGKKGQEPRRIKKRNARITRIYVSQKYTCWNGRKNWNIPKHLASFDWHHAADGTTTVKVFPHDISGSSAEAAASPTPFFQGSFKPIPYVPSFPISTNLLKYVGLDATLAQPPLPEGPQASQGELPGTDRWCAIVPGQSTRRATVGWFDVQQENGGQDGSRDEKTGHANFWPGLGRWHIGVRMENSDIDFPEATFWDAPKSVL